MKTLSKNGLMRAGLLILILAGTSQVPVQGLAQADSIRTGQGGNVPAQASEKMEKALLIVTPEYFIGPEDVLNITVWRNADLSREVTVRPDGRISLPLIGDIIAVGRTPAQLSEDISSKLKEYKENPQVSIVITAVNSYAIYVLGEVLNQGSIHFEARRHCCRESRSR